MILRKFEKGISVFTIFAYLLGFISIPATTYSNSYGGLTEIRISNSDFSYNDSYEPGVNNIYLDASEISEEQLWTELQSYYSAQLVGEERAHHINIYGGDDCIATVCVSVTVDYGTYSFETRSNFYLEMSSGSTGSTSYSSSSTVSTGDSGATSGQRSTLNTINGKITRQNSTNSGIASQISKKNSELSDLNSSHASAKSALASVEQERDVALTNLNSAITNRNSAVNERQQAKQEASNAKIEADRQQTAVNQQKVRKTQLETDLAQLKVDSENLLNQNGQYTNQLKANRSTIDQKIIDAQGEIAQIIDRHNQIADTIINDLGIAQAAEDLNIDYSNLVETPNDFDAPVLPNGAAIQTPKSHPKYNDLVDAINYHESMRDYVNNSTSDQVKHAHTLSEVGIIQADQAYAEGQDAEGDAYLEGAFTVMDSIMDFIPGVSFIKDVTSIVTGVNPITGEDVSDTERALLLGSLFIPSALSGTGKVIGKAAKALQTLSGKGNSTADEVLNVIARADQSLDKYSHAPCGVISQAPVQKQYWGQSIASSVLNSATPLANATGAPCDLGAKVDDLKRRFNNDQVKALAETKPGQYYEGVEELWKASKYRKNMKDLDDTPDLPSDFEAHHIMPKQFEEEFKEAGVWVHDPRIMAPIPKALHTDVHANGYNNRWEEFFDSAPDYDSTITKAKELAKEFGFEDLLKGYF